MKSVIEYSDFEKLDFRVGEVVAATAPDWSTKLLELTVDFGQEIGQKTILTGIRQWYGPQEFIGKRYVFVVNLAERKMGEGVSQGMMIMGDGEDQPRPFAIHEEMAPGTVLR